MQYNACFVAAVLLASDEKLICCPESVFNVRRAQASGAPGGGLYTEADLVQAGGGYWCSLQHHSAFNRCSCNVRVSN